MKQCAHCKQWKDEPEFNWGWQDRGILQSVCRYCQHGQAKEHYERTLLAWIRTGIATISLGFVIARFSFWLREIAVSTSGRDLNISQTGLSLPMGIGMVAFGAFMTFTGLLSPPGYSECH